MLLAGDAMLDGVETVKLVEPPSASPIGAPVFLKDASAPATYPASTNAKQWKKIVRQLSVDADTNACFDSTPLVTADGPCTCPLPEGSGIH